MRTLLCFGDSNTWGYKPTGDGRYARWERWPGVLARELGDAWYVIEEGLNSRTTRYELEGQADRSGLRWLPLALESHAPIDWVVLSLGANDLFVRPPLSACDAASGVAELVRTARTSGQGPAGGAPSILVLSPPPFGELLPAWREESPHGEEESKRFSGAFAAMAERLKVPLLILEEIVASSHLDGVHFSADAHATIGRSVAGWFSLNAPSDGVGSVRC